MFIKPGIFLTVLLACAALSAGCNTQPKQTSSSLEAPRTEAAIAATSSANLPVEAEPASTVTPSDDFSVYFAPGSSQLSIIEKEKLRSHAERLKAEPKSKITLIGHTGDTGSHSFNLALADMRVSAISNALKALGVPERRILRKMGERNRQAIPCKTSECQQNAHRVELIYKPAAR